MALQFKQSSQEVDKVIADVEKSLLVKGKTIHFIPKSGMNPQQEQIANLNGTALAAYLANNHADSNGAINVTFDSVFKSAVALYKSKAIKPEADAAAQPKPVLVSNGKVNHAHRAELGENDVLNRQADAQETAEGRKKAAELWQEAEAVIQAHRHYRNHAVTRRDQQELLKLMKSLYTEAGRHSPAQAYEALIKVKDLSRRLGDKHQ